MAIKLERIDNYFIITNTVTLHEDRYPTADIYFRSETNTVAFMHKFNRSLIHSFLWVDLVDKDLASLTKLEAIDFLEKNTGGQQEIDVSIQDQTSPSIIAKLSVIENETTLSVAGILNQSGVGQSVITVTDATGFITGKYVSIFDISSNRFYLGNVVSVSGSDIILDTPLDFSYPIGSFVTSGFTDMSVDGSTTPVIFGLRNTTEAIGTSFDMTRIFFTVLSSGAPAYDLFGDLPKLANGIVFRKVDGTFRNIFNLKTNGEVSGIMFDIVIADKVNPNQGQNGYIARLTFAGQNKLGVAVRLEPGEDLQLIIQDNLSSLELLEIVAEGHEVVD